MTITQHAHLRMNERITPMGFNFARNFAKNEIESGTPIFTLCKDGIRKTKVINNGIIYIVDETSKHNKIVVTVYLESECQE
ncbi:hypothetical protein JOC95_001892 [Bacillus tianshenii]|uniref:DUF4258 domain-containing protein n=1 Tax=Sutcliffiella tianshenii TaxID=1463404 RepID=A0ABS2NZF3_9BACI|nr:hypothetical protein [Bacillus tianshenii]MBM7620040.1 hypothetical protein [Bacillus tianshenii]